MAESGVGLGGLEDGGDLVPDVLEDRGDQLLLGREDVVQRAQRHGRLAGHRPQGGAGHTIAAEHGAGRGHQLTAAFGRSDVRHPTPP